MNADLSIHRMAFREAESLGLAQALVAKKRQEMELRVQRERVLEGASPAGASLDSTLRTMEDRSADQTRRRADDAKSAGRRVDKTA